MFYINVRLTTGNRKGCLASRPGAAPGITHARSGLPQASCEALGAGTLARGCGGCVAVAAVAAVAAAAAAAVAAAMAASAVVA